LRIFSGQPAQSYDLERHFVPAPPARGSWEVSGRRVPWVSRGGSGWASGWTWGFAGRPFGPPGRERATPDPSSRRP